VSVESGKESGTGALISEEIAIWSLAREAIVHQLRMDTTAD